MLFPKLLKLYVATVISLSDNDKIICCHGNTNNSGIIVNFAKSL